MRDPNIKIKSPTSPTNLPTKFASFEIIIQRLNQRLMRKFGFFLSIYHFFENPACPQQTHSDRREANCSGYHPPNLDLVYPRETAARSYPSASCPSSVTGHIAHGLSFGPISECHLPSY